MGGDYDLGIHGKISIRTDVREIGWESVDWMHLGQDRDHWWTLVYIVMNFQVP
jgi:hypothetical protein